MFGMVSKNRYGFSAYGLVIAAGIMAVSSPSLAQNRNAGGGLGRSVGGLGNAVGGAVGAVGGALGGAHVGVSANVGAIGANSNTSLNGGGLNSNTTASVGNAVNAGVSASATSARGVNANVGLGTPAADADVSASLNGQNGVNANIGVNAPPGTGTGTGGTGDTGATGATGSVGTGSPGTTGVSPGTNVNIGNVSSQFANMSRSERVALKKRCALILGASSEYDADLLKLCRMLAKM